MDASGSSAFSEPTPVPGHRSERRAVRMRGYCVLDCGTSHEIFVLDLSYEGCGIETPVPLEPGQSIKLSVLRRGAIDAVVRWCRGSKAGLSFVPMEPEARAYAPRQSERIALAADVRLRRVGRSTFRVNVTDLSPEGCKVLLVERPSKGERVLVKFDGLEVLEANVCWVEDFTAGLSFEKPMHPAVFELLIERLTL
ncbi:MAG TPA: PilZ domain-containing protein [Sphingomicrobium sp.]